MSYSSLLSAYLQPNAKSHLSQKSSTCYRLKQYDETIRLKVFTEIIYYSTERCRLVSQENKKNNYK